ncbi:MAG: translation initiation factor IF-3 [Kiritimatiellae bacterium]|nr:translation initiation factor IF-3 [Kiritimatiellia bacterium]
MRVNNQIRVSSIRLIGPDGEQLGIVPTYEALTRARHAGLDLVEIAPTAQPPVCRIMDFGKYKFELAKKEKDARKHQSNQRIKEVKFHPNVEEHDYNTKLRQIRQFIEEGHRVKASLMFRGREQAHKEIGHQLMRRVMKDIEDVARTERSPEEMGRFIFMMITPGASRKAGGAPEGKPAGQAHRPAPQPR